MRKLLLTLSVCGLFALSSMVLYPVSDTFAKAVPTGPITMEEVDATNVIYAFEGAIGYLDFSVSLENNGDDELFVYVRLEVVGGNLTDAYVLDDVEVLVPAHGAGTKDLFWYVETPQDLTEGVYTVTAFVSEDPNSAPIISVSNQFEVEILGAG
ncbi:MAG: hypothetical protein ACUZ77_01880 [Candidatus Brocadiales bacterium]